MDMGAHTLEYLFGKLDTLRWYYELRYLPVVLAWDRVQAEIDSTEKEIKKAVDEEMNYEKMMRGEGGASD